MYKILVFLLVAMPFRSFSAELPYSVAHLPLPLTVGADAVVRQMQVKLDIKSSKKSVETVKKAITILNKNGEHFARFEEFYSGNSINLQDFKGTIYDALGKKVLSIKKGDLNDFSTNWSNYVLFDGGHVKYYEPQSAQYPYTIEYEYELHTKGSLYYSPFLPQASYGIAVEEARFEVSGEANTFRKKAINLPANAVYTETPDLHTWQLKNLSAIIYEPLLESFKQIAPHIMVAPNDFEYHGFNGNMSDWKGLGAWSYMLQKDRDILPAAAIADMQALRQATPNDRELVRKIYEYMQTRSRYIYIGYGIGGFQPISAEKVHEVGYGDCKALSNYTKALLKAAGIKAYTAIIYAGDGDQYDSFTHPDFASIGQANHLITCVPLGKDTVWLECTSQNLPAGFLGDFTDNRRALLVTENGGVMVRTPQYTAADNQIISTLNIKLGANGSSSTNAETKYSGLPFGNQLQIATQTNKDQIKHFQKKLYHAVTVEMYALDQTETQKRVCTERIKWQTSAQAALTGKRMFLPLQVYKPDFQVNIENGARKTPFFIAQNTTYDQTTNIEIPANFKIEALPQNSELKTAFGFYKNEITQNNTIITIHRTFVIQNGSFPADKYQSYKDFLAAVANNDASKIVLIQQ
jgi:transglutaminase-like putative cysteine protease